MKRDDEFVRELLVRMENEESYFFLSPGGIGVETDAEAEREHYHLLLMEDAGLVARLNTKGHTFRLTNNGHDFLEVTRKSATWEKAKDLTQSAGTSTLKMLFDVALEIGKKELADRFGMPL